MSKNTESIKMQFAQRIRDGSCVICGNKQPVEDLKIQSIKMPTKEKEGGFFYHSKCIPKVTVDFAQAMINCKSLDDINNMLNS